MPIFVLKPSLIYLSRSLFEIEVKVSAAMKDSAILLKWRRGVKEDTRITLAIPAGILSAVWIVILSIFL